jgi:hypothetical protein
MFKKAIAVAAAAVMALSTIVTGCGSFNKYSIVMDIPDEKTATLEFNNAAVDDFVQSGYISVEEGEGKPQTLLEMNYGMFVINSNVASNPGLLRACKEFLAFLYTDAELSAYTASTSILRSMNYSLLSNDVSRISSYGAKLINSVSSGNSRVVYFSAENATFKANTASFQQSWTNAVFSVEGIPSLYEALAQFGYNVSSAFEAHKLTSSVWNGMYKG